METLKNFLWPIIAIGALGAFIDFLIGKAGQEKAKDFLLKWWMRFDDVRWRNFGKEEGLVAGTVIERWFGQRAWSFRRILSFAILYRLILLLRYIQYAAQEKGEECHYYCGLTCYYCHIPFYGAIVLVIYWVGFTLSVSFTKFLTFRIAYLCGTGMVKNFILFVIMLLVNFTMFVIWSPVISMMKFRLLGTIDPNIFDLYKTSFAIDLLTLVVVPFFPSLFRFLLSAVFVGSFLLRPLVMRPVSLVWARIVESEKPVFTLIFGSLGAFASAISEAAKHL
jgi:hypothetical protein